MAVFEVIVLRLEVRPVTGPPMDEDERGLATPFIDVCKLDPVALRYCVLVAHFVSTSFAGVQPPKPRSEDSPESHAGRAGHVSWCLRLTPAAYTSMCSWKALAIERPSRVPRRGCTAVG